MNPDSSESSNGEDSLRDRHDRGERIRIGEHIVLLRRGKRGVWTADFHYVDENGHRQHGRKSLRTRNRRAAESKARELEEKLRKREFRGTATEDLATAVQESIRQYIASKEADGCSRKTIVKYSGELLNFASYLKEHQGIVALRALTLRHVDLYKIYRRDVDGLDAYTVCNHLIIIKGWFGWCREQRMIAANPLSELKIRQPRRRRHPAARLEQVNAILGRARGWLFGVLITLAFTGMRVGRRWRSQRSAASPSRGASRG